MLKIAVLIKDRQEEFLLDCLNEGKSYSWVIRKALQEYMDKLDVAHVHEAGNEKNLKGNTPRGGGGKSI